MCGIVGYIGKENSLDKLIHGLKKLEYRGYDSSGVAVRFNNEIKIFKTVGRVNNLESIIDYEYNGNMGIGHTRWATHGGVTDINSHPHKVGRVTIVHNGILENYNELKQLLISKGYEFISETDTEVACAYIDYIYSEKGNIIETLNYCMKMFIGSYAIVGILDCALDELFIMKKDSPLVIATSTSGNYIASDISAYANVMSKYFLLEDGMIGVIKDDDISIYKNDKKVKIKFESINIDCFDTELHGFEHYMLKEIHEQKDLVTKWYEYYFNNDNFNNLINVNKFNKIHIVACGTAYHAGMIGKYLLEYYGNVEVQVFIASEYRYQKLFIDNNTLVIFISQSGETADTIACIKKVNEYKVNTLGIVNVHNSSVARMVDEVIYTEALNEIAVASTKAYTAQVYVLSLLALKLAVYNNKIRLNDVISSYHNLNILIDKVLNYDYSSIIDLIWNREHMFYLGRNIDYVSMMEGSLKLKEISYIHSEAMSAGELKHGTISLMNEDTCVIVMATLDELINKTISNIKEVKSRGAKVILFINEDMVNKIDSDCYDIVIPVFKTEFLIQPIVNVVYLQIIAYEVAKRLGRDIDKPRNLAKSVTVE